MSVYDVEERHLSPGEVIHDLAHVRDVSVEVFIVHTTSSVSVSLPAVQTRVDMSKKVLSKRFSKMESPSYDVTLEQGVEGLSRLEWIPRVEEQLLWPLDSERGPLWKMHLLESLPAREGAFTRRDTHELVVLLKIHPSIIDQVSAHSLLVYQFLPLLNARLSDRHLPPVDKVPRLPLLPPVDESFTQADKALSWKQQQAERREEIRLLGVGAAAPPVWSVLADTQVPSTSKLVPFMCDAESTSGFVSAASSAGVALHAALLTLCGVSLRNAAGACGVVMSDALSCLSVTDLRAGVTPDRAVQSLGRWSGTCVVRIEAGGGRFRRRRFWAEASRVDEQLNKAMRQRRWLSDMRYDARRVAATAVDGLAPRDDPHRVHLELHDLGVVGGRGTDTMADLGVVGGRGKAAEGETGAWFGTRRLVNSSVPLSIGCARLGQVLCWCVTYNERWVTRAFADRFASMLNGLFTSLANKEKNNEYDKDYRIMPPYVKAELTL